MRQITHTDIEKVAIRFLRSHGYLWDCRLFAVEPTGAWRERPDVIGFAPGYSHVVECKMSREDFLADYYKPWRITHDNALGTYRWWLCPEDVIAPQDIRDDDDGLLWVSSNLRDIHILRRAKPRDASDRNLLGELAILYSIANKRGRPGK